MTSKNHSPEMLRALLEIGGNVEEADTDGTLLKDALRRAEVVGIPLTKEALHAFIIGLGMGVVMKGDTEEARKEKSKETLDKFMYLYMLADEGRL